MSVIRFCDHSWTIKGVLFRQRKPDRRRRRRWNIGVISCISSTVDMAELLITSLTYGHLRGVVHHLDGFDDLYNNTVHLCGIRRFRGFWPLL